MAYTLNELNTSIKLTNDNVKFSGSVDGQQPISIDYTPPLGNSEGYTSLELLMLSLTSCIGTTMLMLLRRMGKSILDFEVKASGIRREEHPTGIKEISMQIITQSDDITNDDLDKALKITEEKYCPVWSMLNKDVNIKVEYLIKNMP
ncbi:MAG: OsmC family protein [Bacteroidales bacterium]|nr:OsmC family protein [Bacteroidales bacterium]